MSDDATARWRDALTARPKDCYTEGLYAQTPERGGYRAAIQRILPKIEAAYLASSDPAPHPVRWKRWLRRPYRKGDPVRFLAELCKIRP